MLPTPINIPSQPHLGTKLNVVFEYCVKRIAQLYPNKELPTHTHNGWACVLFKHLNAHSRQELMTQVKQEYNVYFIGRFKYTFNCEKIIQNFPHFFRNTHTQLPTQDPTYEILQAIHNEINETQNPKNRISYKIQNITSKELANGNRIYIATLDLRNGDEPHLREGLRITIKKNDYTYQGDTIDFNYVDSILYFSSNADIQWHYASNTYLVIDTSFILEALRTRFADWVQSEINHALPIYKFQANRTQELSCIDFSTQDYPKELIEKLDKSQKKAFNGALEHDISFIWGPPGTGKSYTLAAIIRALYAQANERTIVCCVSNVAVDQLVNKVIDIIDAEKLEMKAGQLYRAGHSIDEQILATDYLFPNDEQSKELRSKIQKRKKALDLLVQKLGNINSDEQLQYKQEISDLREQLRSYTEFLVNSSRIVFSTISHFLLSKKINENHFENLIVDEASMLSMPNLMAIASKITKRIILVGDFQQLGPISLTPDKWLRNSVFEYCHINMDSQHPALYQLLNQRRSQPKIVDIINKTFYGDKLQSKETDLPDFVNRPPFPEQIKATKLVKDNEVRFTRGGTRQNIHSAETVIQMLDEYYNNRDFSFTIGIITPYRGQVALLKALVAQKEYTPKFLNQIRIGTVHTFQGSECDLIIFDIVDAPNKTVGKLYGDKEGEQLLNVAISRAKYKFIMVGDPNRFTQGAGIANVTDKTVQIFKRFKVILSI